MQAAPCWSGCLSVTAELCWPLRITNASAKAQALLAAPPVESEVWQAGAGGLQRITGFSSGTSHPSECKCLQLWGSGHTHAGDQVRTLHNCIHSSSLCLLESTLKQTGPVVPPTVLLLPLNDKHIGTVTLAALLWLRVPFQEEAVRNGGRCWRHRGCCSQPRRPGCGRWSWKAGSTRPRRCARMAGDLWGSGCQLLKVHRLGRQRSLPLLCWQRGRCQNCSPRWLRFRGWGEGESWTAPQLASHHDFFLKTECGISLPRVKDLAYFKWHQAIWCWCFQLGAGNSIKRGLSKVISSSLTQSSGLTGNSGFLWSSHFAFSMCCVKGTMARWV